MLAVNVRMYVATNIKMVHTKNEWLTQHYIVFWKAVMMNFVTTRTLIVQGIIIIISSIKTGKLYNLFNW